ncbi:MAG: sigma-70 family RNA polymerase sigma factor [Bacteroidota bacterium]
MQYTDAEIIQLLSSSNAQDNDQGIRIMYHLYFSMISGFVLKNSGTKEDVEEVFQDGIFVVFNKCKKEELVLTSRLKTYLYSICRNIWLKTLKQKKFSTVSIQDQEDFIMVESSFFQKLELTEERQTMLDLIKQLGENCQKVLIYYYYERLKMKEIAQLMNFANDQVARNKKVKCLKQLVAIVDNSSFFKNYFK